MRIYDGNVFVGYRNESQNDIFLLTTNEWNYPVYNALEILATKQTDRFQLLGSFTRSWSHLERDVAAETIRRRSSSPTRFPSIAGMELNDNRVASSNNGSERRDRRRRVDRDWSFASRPSITRPGTSTSRPTTRCRRRRWSGPIITRVAAADPQFGPPTVTLSNGRVVSNPLATLNRFAFPTRDEGQFKLPGAARDQPAGRSRVRLRAGPPPPAGLSTVFNVGNLGRFQGFLAGANQLFNVNYGKGGAVQQPVSAQLSARFSF